MAGICKKNITCCSWKHCCDKSEKTEPKQLWSTKLFIALSNPFHMLIILSIGNVKNIDYSSFRMLKKRKEFFTPKAEQTHHVT